MQTSQILHENLTSLETLSATGLSENADTLIPEKADRQRFQHDMQDIWGKVCGVCEGQDRVVLSQLWEFGKKSPASTAEGAINLAPTVFPALVMHGFIVERMADGHAAWVPCSPYLKDFWQVGIQVSNGHGFLLLPEHVFHANVNAFLAMM
jgi:hypothetical protein